MNLKIVIKMEYLILLDYDKKDINELEKYINEAGFIWACGGGHLGIAKWLLEIKPDIDISSCDEYAFRWACGKGHLEVAKWLLEIKPTINISADNEFAFRWTCNDGHLDAAKWLFSIKPTIKDNKIISWKITNNLNEIIDLRERMKKELIIINSQSLINYNIDYFAKYLTQLKMKI